TCALEPSGWADLGAELPRARCDLAEAIARDVADHAADLAKAWGEGDYASALAGAGERGSELSQRDAINLVTDAFFYVDRFVKDMKLGEAAGIAINACGTADEPCLREVEH